MEKDLSYSYEYKVGEADIDELDHVNNVVYVHWIQEAAIRHWSSIAPDHIKKSFVWVIVRHEIDYKRSGKLNDLLHIETRVLNAGGVSSDRQVRIFRKEDMQLLVESKTTWCMIDATTHRPARITDEIREMFLGKQS